MVVANTVASLAEIRDQTLNPDLIFSLDSSTVYKLLAALNECTEWGQVFILDSLSSYVTQDEKEAESVIERVIPRLQHANCAVVMSAVRVIVGQLKASIFIYVSLRLHIFEDVTFTSKYLKYLNVTNLHTIEVFPVWFLSSSHCYSSLAGHQCSR